MDHLIAVVIGKNIEEGNYMETYDCRRMKKYFHNSNFTVHCLENPDETEEINKITETVIT
jgi:hypothetical protein